MKKQFFLVIALCWAFTQLAAQIAFRHITTAANTGATAGTLPHITLLDHPQLNGNPKAIIFILPNFNLNGAEASYQDYTQNAGVWYDGKRWTIFNENTKEPMPLGATFNVMIAPPGNPNYFTFTVTKKNIEANGFPNGALIDHPAANGKTNAMLLLTQNWDGVYNDASQVTGYDRGKWGIANNGYLDYYNGKTKDTRSLMPVGARFNVMVIENKTVPGFPCAQAFQHKASDANIVQAAPWHTFLEPANLTGNHNVILFATAYWGHGVPDPKNAAQASGPYNDGPLMAWFDHPNDEWHYRDSAWALYNSNGARMPVGAKIHVVAIPDSTAPLKACCEHLFAPNATRRDTATLIVQSLFGEGPDTIIVEVIGGYVIFQGDMVIGRERDYFKRVGGKLVPIKKRVKTKTTKDAGTPLVGRLWINARIPFEIAANHPSAAIINRAIATINNTTDLCLTPRTNETDFIRFTNDNSEANGGCWSMIGHQGGGQIVNIGDGCGSDGTILHEILHAAGVFHEQSRPDRDNYVRINWENIKPGLAPQFEKVSRAYSVCPYDFRSIMHYGPFDFNSNGQPTITALVPTNVIGSTSALTECDIKGLRNLYPNATGCRTDPPLTSVLTCFIQPNYQSTGRGQSIGFNRSVTTTRPAGLDIPHDRPISFKIRPGFVATIRSGCGGEFSSTTVIFRDEPNITIPGIVCEVILDTVEAVRTLNLPDFTRHCPTHHTHGDAEFDGHGPVLFCNVNLFDWNGSINLRVQFMAGENAGDFSFVKDEWTNVVFTYPSNQRVLAIDRPSSISAGGIVLGEISGGFLSRPAGFELIPCNEGQVHVSGTDFQLRGELVHDMVIIGDTGAQDINSGNCGCDTAIRLIRFNPVRVFMGRR